MSDTRHKIILEGEEEYKAKLNEIRSAQKDLRQEVEQLNTALEKEIELFKKLGRLMDKEIQNEEAMDKKILDTIKFYYGLTTEQYKHVLSVLKTNSDNGKGRTSWTANVMTAQLADIVTYISLVWMILKYLCRNVSVMVRTMRVKNERRDIHKWQR